MEKFYTYSTWANALILTQSSASLQYSHKCTTRNLSIPTAHKTIHHHILVLTHPHATQKYTPASPHSLQTNVTGTLPLAYTPSSAPTWWGKFQSHGCGGSSAEVNAAALASCRPEFGTLSCGTTQGSYFTPVSIIVWQHFMIVLGPDY